MEISLILPIYNEAESITPLCKEIRAVMATITPDYEIVCVDDGSTDQTAAVLARLASAVPQIKVIQFTRNFGQTAAMSAGFQHAQGKILVPLDADGQNDPASIPDLLTKLAEGYDVVSGIRANRKDKWLTRKLPSWLANLLIGKITGVRLKDYGCSLKAYRAEAIRQIHLYGEMHRFIPALASQTGARITEVPVKHRPRLKGKTKYGLSRTLKVLLDLLTVKFLGTFATKPNYLFGGIGSVFCLAGILCGLEVLIEKYWAGTFAHRNPILLLAVFLFILGVQLVMMGLLAELLVRTYHESQGKQIYLVKQLINLEKKESDVRHYRHPLPSSLQAS